MIRVTYNWDDIKKEMFNGGLVEAPEKSNFYGYTNIHLYIDDLDIIGGAYTPIVYFFGFSFSALSTLDPLYFRNKSLHFGTDSKNKSCVGGEGFQFCFKLEKSTKMLKITYESVASNKTQVLTIPLKEFIEGLIESYRHFYSDLVGFSPEMRKVKKIIYLQEDTKIIEEWHQSQ